jgi:ribA/ribD-fused uncharacterized protein
MSLHNCLKNQKSAIMSDNTPIYFFGQNNCNGYMSNFFTSYFVDEEGNKFNCSEQYFMYRKCKRFDAYNTRLLNAILNETNPSVIKKYGRAVKNYDDDIWNNERYDVMVEALRLKFNQNEDIKKQLIETKPRILYEASPYDKIWGIGFYYRDAIRQDERNFGQNLLGKALMQIRDELFE